MPKRFWSLQASIAWGVMSCLFLGCTQERPQKIEAPAAPSADAPATEAAPAKETAAATPEAPATPAPAEPAANVAPATPATMPEVLLTNAEAAQCKVQVGDTLPNFTLPNLEGQPTQLSSLLGNKVTVVVFWTSQRPMSRAQLADLGPDIAAPNSGRGVQVIGIAVGETPDAAREQAAQAGVTFPILVDQDGSAFAQVGSDKPPYTYLIDATGKILWFDIDYSRATRRELQTGVQSALAKDAT